MDERPSDTIVVPHKLTITPEPSDIGIVVKYRRWLYLKECIARISTSPGLFCHTVGSLAAPFCPIAILNLVTTDFSSAPAGKIIWLAVAISTPIVSITAWYFGHKSRRLDAFRAADIVKMMEDVEADYILPESTPAKCQFGAYWNEDDQPLCLRCRNLLQPGSKPKTFWCSNPQCNKKHYLKTDADEIITLEEAKAMLKGED